MLIKEDIDRVRVLRLASPPSNVLGSGLLEALRKEVAAAAGDQGVRCLVLASAYERYFSTGLDLSELTALPPERQLEPFEALIGLHRALVALPKPTLAVLSGSAILGGWILAMGCDFRLISHDGRISLSEIRMGLSPTSGLIGRMLRLASSPGAVKEMVLRGRALKAEEALAAGLVDEVVPAPELAERALAEAKSLAKLSPPAYAQVKASLNAGAGDEEIWRRSREEAAALFALPQVQEGLAAMRDKRRPRWESADV